MKAKGNDKEYAQIVRDTEKAYEMLAMRAACSMNRDTLQLYWNLGEKLASAEAERRHGSHFIGAVARRLGEEMPERGFSAAALGYMRRFYLLYRGIAPQELEALFCLPWPYHKCIMDRCGGDTDKALYYAGQALSLGLSRADLASRMALSFYERAGRSAEAMKPRLPEYGSALGQELVQDMEGLPFHTRRMARKAGEPLKKALARFFVGNGLACCGMDVAVRTGDMAVVLDLVMYSRALRRCIVAEFVHGEESGADKATALLHASALDASRPEGEGEAIGLLICKTESGVRARYVCGGPDPLDLSALPSEGAIEAALA